MISGTVAAALFALSLLTATVGAIAVGFWASGASPETTGNLTLGLIDDEFASISFTVIVLGLVSGLGKPLGLLIGLISFISLVSVWPTPLG